MTRVAGQTATLAEQTFHQLLLDAGIPADAIEREHRFAPPRRWRADFYLPRCQLIIEVDGGTWTGGRHQRGRGYINDCEKLNEAMMLGLAVLRTTTDGNQMVQVSRQAATYYTRHMHRVIHSG